jgi:hypothetical protein
VAFTNSLARDHSRRDLQSRRHLHIPRARAESTLGDLIVALTEETRSYVRGEEEVYRIVAYMVKDLLSRRRCLSKSWQ